LIEAPPAASEAYDWKIAPAMLADRRQFYLLIRGLGLYLLILAFRDLVSQVMIDTNEGALDESWVSFWFSHLPSYWPVVAELAVGGYCFFDGRRILDRVTPLREGRCWGCSYDLSGVIGPCPECGQRTHQLAPFHVGPAPADPPWMRASKWPVRFCFLFAAVFTMAFVAAQVLKHSPLVYIGPDGLYKLAL